MINRLGLLAIPLLLASCSNPQSTPAAATTATDNSQVVGIPAPGSKFSRIRIGMDKKEVEDLIGAPTDQNSHITGKVFIPFYFGGGTSEIDAHYKGEGVLTYSSNSVGSSLYKLIEIKVDRSDRGYAQ